MRQISIALLDVVVLTSFYEDFIAVKNIKKKCAILSILANKTAAISEGNFNKPSWKFYAYKTLAFNKISHRQNGGSFYLIYKTQLTVSINTENSSDVSKTWFILKFQKV